MKLYYDSDHKYVTIREVAKELNINPQTIRSWVKKGKLRGYRLGERSVRILRSDLNRFIKESTVDSI